MSHITSAGGGRSIPPDVRFERDHLRDANFVVPASQNSVGPGYAPVFSVTDRPVRIRVIEVGQRHAGIPLANVPFDLGQQLLFGRRDFNKRIALASARAVRPMR